MRIVIGVVVSCLLGVALAEEYPIGCWTFVRQEQSRSPEQVVRDWKDLGLTHPMSPEVGLKSDKAYLRRMLDLCAREGLKLIVHDARVHLSNAVRTGIVRDDAAYRRDVAAAAADWAQHPAFAGFHLYDEPNKSHHAALFRAVKVVREAIPERICFLNLLPWYQWIGKVVGAADCASYLDMMAQETGLDLFCYDLYDHADEDTGEGKGQNLYFENLRERMAFVRRNPGKGFWYSPICLDQHTRRIRSQEMIRWQLTTAAAMGARGVMWYFLEMPHMNRNVRHMPINIFGERTENFRWLSEENRVFQHQFGSEFMRLSIEDARLLNADCGGLRPFEPDADILGAETWGEKKPVLMSSFRDADGVRYLALVNLLRDRSAHLTLWLGEGVSVLNRNWDRTYGKISAEADPALARRFGSGRLSTVAFDFAAGQLYLVKLVRSK